MVKGFQSFARWFQGYEKEYAIIGGTACDLLMSAEGLAFRATKDIDLVLILEALTPEFGERFWQYIVQAGYEHRNKRTGEPQFYRFSHPKSREYPFMIELFTRRTEKIRLPDEAVLTPLPLEGDVSSLSALRPRHGWICLPEERRAKLWTAGICGSIRMIFSACLPC